MAFLSSAVLEFFTSISIAIMAVYFGFSFLGQLEFVPSGVPITLFSGFFCLILAPEFYQPLRDLGTYYHDRASAIGAADAIVDFLEQDYLIAQSDTKQPLEIKSAVEIAFHIRKRSHPTVNLHTESEHRYCISRSKWRR